MEASNIQSISDDAKMKKKKINVALDILYKRLSILEKRLIEIENIKAKKDEKLKSQVDKEKFKFKNDEIKDLISKRDFAKALAQSKKFVFEFQ